MAALQERAERRVGALVLWTLGVRLDHVVARLGGDVRVGAERPDPERVTDGDPTQRSGPGQRLDLVESEDLCGGATEHQEEMAVP
jgi:hypothetical protein